MYSSDMKFDMEKEYILQSYEYLKKENNPELGVGSSSGVHISPLYFDELCYILKSSGTHVFLFGGTWNKGTQDNIDRINYLAGKYNVTVYNFDFRADGEHEDTNIKADITAQDEYDGPDKTETAGCAVCNYEYGELVSRYLTNLECFTASKAGKPGDITYLNLYQDAVSVPDIREPFLFVYDKDFREGPIVSGLEIDFGRNDQNALAEIEKVFRSIEENNLCVTPYTHADYMYEAFKMNERGHAFKTEDCFKMGEQINIQPMCLPMFRWLLDQDGSFIVVFAGAWCANSQGGITTINDYAVANDVRIYMMDSRLDGKHPIDFWGYPRVNELRLAAPGKALAASNAEIWEEKLAGAPILARAGQKRFGKPASITVDYVDDEGITHSTLPIDIPYLIAFDRNHMDDRGEEKKPVLAAHNHGGIELINCKPSFIYYAPNYLNYRGGVYRVLDAYFRNIGGQAKDISIDRTAPLEKGEPVENPRRKAEQEYFKDHDWAKERAGRMEKKK